MRIESLIQQNLVNFSTIHSLPFNEALHRGSLPIPVFKSFLEQDRLYLLAYAKALQKVAGRLENKEHGEQFRLFASKTIELEKLVQDSYLRKLSYPSIFDQRVEKIPVIAEYCQHLLSTAEEGSVEEAIASLAPCFLVYKELGEWMALPDSASEHPFRDWINTYSDKEFVEDTAKFVAIADELFEQVACPLHQERIAQSFKKSLCFERRFFEDIYSIRDEAELFMDNECCTIF